MNVKTQLPNEQHRIKNVIQEEQKQHIRSQFEKDCELVLGEITQHINHLNRKYMCINRGKIVSHILNKLQEIR